ncbi:MAG: protein kinase domain-containing protein, partial [Actinomycetaceae bacterium]
MGRRRRWRTGTADGTRSAARSSGGPDGRAARGAAGATGRDRAGARTPTVPGYRLSRRLAGGSGRVYSATAEETGRAVICSLLESRGGKAAEGDPMLRRLSSLQTAPHRHLARVVDVVELEGGSLAVVTELVPGATLSSIRTARGGLTVPEVASILADVGDALAHLAARGVVHGDVSPANVIVDLVGQIVLVDLVGDVRIETGTPGFTAPERAAGGPASTASDVWALAAMVRDLAGGDAQVEHLTRDALDDDPGMRPTARALAARAAELGRRSSVRLPDSADMATALLRESALREATTHAPVQRARAGGGRTGGGRTGGGRTGGGRTGGGRTGGGRTGGESAGRRSAPHRRTAQDERASGRGSLVWLRPNGSDTARG